MDVAAWLQGLGLERYGQAFRDNEIDWEVLPKLTSDDLREIGVACGRAPAQVAGCYRRLGRFRARDRCVGTAGRNDRNIRIEERRRAAAAYGHVLRPRRLDRA